MLIFRPNWRFALMAAMFLPITVSAGFWQLGRAEDKREQQSAFEREQDGAPATCEQLASPGQVNEYRRARLRGHYEGERQFAIDNRTLGGRAGYQVVTGFRCESGPLVAVDRGWVAIPEGRRELVPELLVTGIPVTLFGTLIRRPDQAPSEPVAQGAALDEWGASWPRRIGYWNHLQVDSELGGIHRLWLVLEDGQPGALETVFPERNFKIRMHEGYAFQWFAISAGIVIWFGFTAIGKGRSGRSSTDDPNGDRNGRGGVSAD